MHEDKIRDKFIKIAKAYASMHKIIRDNYDVNTMEYKLMMDIYRYYYEKYEKGFESEDYIHYYKYHIDYCDCVNEIMDLNNYFKHKTRKVRKTIIDKIIDYVGGLIC